MTAVVIPVLNGAHVLPDTIPAVLALSGVDEWVWVNDGSTDETAEILARLTRHRPNVRVVSLATNQGRGAARNAGVAATEADQILFLDADVAPESDLAIETSRALSAPDVVAAVGRFQPEVDDPREPYAVYLRRSSRGSNASHGEVVGWKYFLTAAVGVSRASFDAVGGFDESIPYGEDLELAARLSVDHPNGLVSSGTTVAIGDVDSLDGVLGRMRTFGEALPAILAETPGVLDIAGLRVAVQPSASRAVARSRGLAWLVRASLPILPERGVALGVRYLLAHALARSVADATPHSR